MPNILSLLKYGTVELKAFDTKKIDTEILLSHVLDKDRTWLYTWPEKKTSKTIAEQYYKLVDQRKSGMPIAYITSHKEFWSLDFKVTPKTLIPRPETECLIEIALKNIVPNNHILELGTGSGIISIVLGKECQNCTITATDLSRKALNVAQENAKAHHVNNIKFIQSNWYENVKNQKFSLIISNPPYIGETEKNLMNIETKYEPKLALMSGQDGLNAIKEIIKNAKNHLHHNGKIILEHGFMQSEEIKEIFTNYAFINIQSYQDIQAQTRVTIAHKKSA